MENFNNAGWLMYQEDSWEMRSTPHLNPNIEYIHVRSQQIILVKKKNTPNTLCQTKMTVQW